VICKVVLLSQYSKVSVTMTIPCRVLLLSEHNEAGTTVTHNPCRVLPLSKHSKASNTVTHSHCRVLPLSQHSKVGTMITHNPRNIAKRSSRCSIFGNRPNSDASCVETKANHHDRFPCIASLRTISSVLKIAHFPGTFCYCLHSCANKFFRSTRCSILRPISG
jgi:hypothetical protein